jgi:hypothetical protein
MGLETGVTYIEDLVATNPVGATDNVDEGDDHIRNIKTAVKGSFPNLGAAAVTSSAAELNLLDGATTTDISGSSLLAGVINAVYPVGSVYASTVATNPGTLLGVGTWVATGVGRVLVGVGTSDATYGLDDTGGSSDVTDVYPHTHPQQVGTNQNAYITDGTGAQNGSVVRTDANNATRLLTDSTGAAGVGDNMPPYLVVHMWERTA